VEERVRDVAPRLADGRGANETQSEPKPLAREALINDGLFLALWLQPRFGKDHNPKVAGSNLAARQRMTIRGESAVTKALTLWRPTHPDRATTCRRAG